MAKRLKLSTEFDAKLFCGRLNVTKPHLLEVCGQFLDAVKEDNNVAVVEFCRVSNNGEELIQWLTHAGQLQNRNYKFQPTPTVVLKPVEVQMLLECVDKILTPIVAAATDVSDEDADLSCYLPFAIRLARGIISSPERMRAVYRQMLSGMPTSYILEAINVLITMTLLGPEVTKELVEVMDFTHPALQHNSNTSTSASIKVGEVRSSRDKWEIGKSMLRLTVALLMNGNETAVERIVSARGFVNSVLADIYFAPPEVAVQLLSVLSEKVVHSKSLRKTTKVKVFNNNALMFISSLYVYTGKFQERQDRKHLTETVLAGVNWSEGGGEMTFNRPPTDTEEVLEVRRAAHEFLMDLCCSIAHGIVFFDKNFLIGDTESVGESGGMENDNNIELEDSQSKVNRNITLTYFLKNLAISKLIILPEVRLLIFAILKAAADLHIHFFDALKPFMMAKDDSHWLTISSLVYELISFESKEDNRWKVSCGKVKPLGLEKIIQIIDGHKHRQRSVLQAIVCPQPIIDAYFTGALSSNSWGQLVVGLKILASVSIRFLILWNGSKDESKDVLRRIASQLPSANSIGDLWAKLVQKMKSATDFDDFQACCNALCHCSIAFLMYSEVSAGPLPHSCLDKCVQDVAALSIIPKFPMYSKSHRALQSNLTVALARTCNDYSLLFRKTKISQSVFGILLTALLEEPQQRGYHYGILAEFLGRNCFLQPFANDLLLWLSLVKNKEFLEELFRVALCNPYPYFMKDAFWTRRDDVPTSKGLLQLALKSKMDLTVSCTYVKNSQKSSVEANILLAVCAELLIKKEFESDQQIQSDVVKVLQLMRSCGRDVASVFSSLKEIEVSNEEASLMAETTKTFWNILRTEVMQDPEFESDTTSSKRWRKSLKLKLGELVSSFSKTDHACTFDVLAQLLFGLFQTISACDSDIQWSKMEKIWNKLIEWTVSSIMEETDQTTGLELIDQMEFMIQKSLAAKKWREKCNFTQYLTEKRSRYLTEAEKPQNTEDKHAADDNEAITDRENSSVEINNDYLKLLNQCSIGGEDKKGVKSIKRDLRRCWDKLVVFVLKNHYKSPAVIRLLAKALHLATPKTQMDDSMEISDNSNSNLQRLVDMVFTHSEFGQVMIDTVCSEPKSAIVYLLFNSCLIGSEAEAIPMRESCVPLLLSCYGATLSTADQMILAILELCERQGRFDFSSYSPLLWGKRAAQHYSSLKLLGPSLWIRPTVDEVLDLIDPDIMLTTGIHIPLELLLNTAADKLLSVLNQTVGNLYDPRFILPLMVSLLLPNQELNCKKIVEKNILGLAIATLSCRDRDLRGLGYLMLNRFRKMLKTSEKFTSRAQIICLLNALKEGVTEENQRVPCVITIFLVKSAQILLNPENQLFKLISSFITLKPALDLENIPEFYKLFNSGSLREHHAERKWLLELMHEGLRDSRDYRIYEKRYAFKLLMSYYQCSLATTDEKRLILQLLRLACRMKSSTVDLCKNYNLIGWISSVIAIQLSTVKLTETSLVPEEVADLSELLGIVWETVKEVKDERSKNEEEKKDLEGSQIGLPKYFICNFFACVSTLVAICCKDSNVHLTEINESAIDQLVNRLRTVKEQNQMV